MTAETCVDQHAEKPTVRVEPGKLPEVVDQAEAALMLGAQPIYQMGGMLVRPAEGAEADQAKSDGIERPSGAPRLIPVSAVLMREMLTRAAKWEKWDGRKGDWVEIDCSMAVANALVERREWKLPELTGYLEAAAVRPDGTIIAAKGYDRITGLYVTKDSAIPARLPTGKALSLQAAIKAGDRLFQIFNTFPAVDPSDSAACVAAVMTFLNARTMPAVPLVAVTATAAGTGKTKLVDGCSVIATGRPSAVMAAGQDGAEMEKRLAAALLAGNSPVNIDNLERSLHGDMLCQACTQSVLSVRPLGGSALVRVPTRVALAATGNNLVIRGDLNRRVLLIRLDAGMEHPEQRSFDNDFLEEVRRQRLELIEAALTISASYAAAGFPAVQCLPLGGFDIWDRLVRRALIWIGFPDPLAPASMGRDDDPDRSAMVALLGAWRQVYGDRAVTAAEVAADAVRGTPRFDGGGVDFENPELHEAVAQACADKVNPRKLGYALRRWKGRIADNFRLEHAGTTGAAKVVAWRVFDVQNG